MAKAKRTLKGNDATLIEISIESLPQSAQKLFAEYKVAYKAATAIRDKFEALMQDAAKANKTTDDTTELFFGYNFGKLAIGVADRTVKSASSRKAVDFAKLVA